MKAAATFAAAYGFPPSACRDAEEATVLLKHIEHAIAVRAVSTALGAAAVVSKEGVADLMERLGGASKDGMKMRLDAMVEAAKRGDRRW